MLQTYSASSDHISMYVQEHADETALKVSLLLTACHRDEGAKWMVNLASQQNMQNDCHRCCSLPVYANSGFAAIRTCDCNMNGADRQRIVFIHICTTDGDFIYQGLSKRMVGKAEKECSGRVALSTSWHPRSYKQGLCQWLFEPGWSVNYLVHHAICRCNAHFCAAQSVHTGRRTLTDNTLHLKDSQASQMSVQLKLQSTDQRCFSMSERLWHQILEM